MASRVNTKERVWDCGAGNGQASVAIAEYFSEVQATDISDRYIAHAIPKNNVFYSVRRSRCICQITIASRRYDIF